MLILSYSAKDEMFFVACNDDEFSALKQRYDFINGSADAGYYCREHQNKEHLYRVCKDWAIKEGAYYFFAVKKDLSQFVLHTPYFPIAPMWNGYSPWQSTTPMEIYSLEAIRNRPTGKSGFSVATKNTLGYYVYALIDPLNNSVFYIGKGVNDRVFRHEQEDDRIEKEKNLRIRKIKNSGYIPVMM